MIEDFCEFYKQCVERPTVLRSFTVGDYLRLRAHLYSCDRCLTLVEKFLAEHPDDDGDSVIFSNSN